MAGREADSRVDGFDPIVGPLQVLQEARSVEKQETSNPCYRVERSSVTTQLLDLVGRKTLYGLAGVSKGEQRHDGSLMGLCPERYIISANEIATYRAFLNVHFRGCGQSHQAIVFRAPELQC